MSDTNYLLGNIKLKAEAARKAFVNNINNMKIITLAIVLAILFGADPTAASSSSKSGKGSKGSVSFSYSGKGSKGGSYSSKGGKGSKGGSYSSKSGKGSKGGSYSSKGGKGYDCGSFSYAGKSGKGGKSSKCTSCSTETLIRAKALTDLTVGTFADEFGFFNTTEIINDENTTEFGDYLLAVDNIAGCLICPGAFAASLMDENVTDTAAGLNIAVINRLCECESLGGCSCEDVGFAEEE